MNVSLHTLGWTDPPALDPDNGCQMFAVGWLRVIAVVDDALHPPGSPRTGNERILRDDDDIIFAVIVAFMEIRDRWH